MKENTTLLYYTMQVQQKNIAQDIADKKGLISWSDPAIILCKNWMMYFVLCGRVLVIVMYNTLPI